MSFLQIAIFLQNTRKNLIFEFQIYLAQHFTILINMGFAIRQEENYSVSTYFEVDTKSKKKYEYYFGQIVAMAGGNVRHSTICINVLLGIARQLNSGKCRVLNSDMKLEVVENEMYVYPDLTVSCHADDVLGDNTLVKYPSLLVEVLSKSTANFDLEDKLNYYLKIPSLQYYLIIDQKMCRVLCYARKEKSWELTIYEAMEESVLLTELDITLLLSDIYQNITFPIAKKKKIS
jgi:Uma2 family endonuclease